MIIYLISDDYDSQIQYNNTNLVSDFKIKLAQNFELVGNWEVALVEAHIPFTWVEHAHIDLFIKIYLQYIDLDNKEKQKIFHINLPGIENKTINDIIKDINKQIYIHMPTAKAIKFKRNKEDNRIQITLSNENFKFDIANNVEVSMNCFNFRI